MAVINITDQTNINTWKNDFNSLAAFVGDLSGLVTGITDNTSPDTLVTAMNYVFTLAGQEDTTFTGAITFTNTILVQGAATFESNVTIDGSLTFNDTGSAAVTIILDEDTMASDSATALATQQSIKAYVDTSVTGVDAATLDGIDSLSFLRSDTNDVFASDNNLDIGSGSGALRLRHNTTDNAIYLTPNIGTAGFDSTKDFGFDGDTEYWFFDDELRVNGLFTSRGIDDNATANVIQIENSSVTLKQATTVQGALTVTSGNVIVPQTATTQVTNGAGEYIQFDSVANDVDIFAGGVLGTKATATAVTLYNAGSAKLATSSTGVSVTGGIAITDGVNIDITNGGGETIRFNSNRMELFAGSNEQVQIQNTDVQLRYSGSTKLATTSAGVSVTGAITATGDLTGNTSDERLKTEITKIPNALNTVMGLNGVRFKWNEESLKINPASDLKKVNLGVIAQDVELIAKEAMGQEVQGFKTVQYDALIPLLIEAIKELEFKIYTLENK